MKVSFNAGSLYKSDGKLSDEAKSSSTSTDLVSIFFATDVKHICLIKDSVLLYEFGSDIKSIKTVGNNIVVTDNKGKNITYSLGITDITHRLEDLEVKQPYFIYINGLDDVNSIDGDVLQMTTSEFDIIHTRIDTGVNLAIYDDSTMSVMIPNEIVKTTDTSFVMFVSEISQDSDKLPILYRYRFMITKDESNDQVTCKANLYTYKIQDSGSGSTGNQYVIDNSQTDKGRFYFDDPLTKDDISKDNTYDLTIYDSSSKVSKHYTSKFAVDNTVTAGDGLSNFDYMIDFGACRIVGMYGTEECFVIRPLEIWLDKKYTSSSNIGSTWYTKWNQTVDSNLPKTLKITPYDILNIYGNIVINYRIYKYDGKTLERTYDHHIIPSITDEVVSGATSLSDETYNNDTYRRWISFSQTVSSGYEASFHLYSPTALTEKPVKFIFVNDELKTDPPTGSEMNNATYARVVLCEYDDDWNGEYRSNNIFLYDTSNPYSTYSSSIDTPVVTSDLTSDISVQGEIERTYNYRIVFSADSVDFIRNSSITRMIIVEGTTSSNTTPTITKLTIDACINEV